MSTDTETLVAPFPGPYLVHVQVEGVYLEPQKAPFSSWSLALGEALRTRPGKLPGLPAPPMVLILQEHSDSTGVLVYGGALYQEGLPTVDAVHRGPYVTGIFPRVFLGDRPTPQRMGEHQSLTQALASLKAGLSGAWSKPGTESYWLRCPGIWARGPEDTKAAPELTKPPLVLFFHGTTWSLYQVVEEGS